MFLAIKVTTNSKKPDVTRVAENSYKVRVDAPAIEGKANSRLIEIISHYFKIPKSSINIVRGHRSRNKVVEIRGFIKL